MRKYGAFIISALLLLLVPALANAWTLTVRVYGPSTAGEVVVTEVDSAGNEKELKKILAGVEYVQISGTNQAKVTVTPTVDTHYVATVFVDNVAVDGNPYLLPKAANQYIEVYFDIDPDKKGNVGVKKESGGTVLLQYNGATTMTGFTNLTFDANVRIKVSPNSDYQVTSIWTSQTDAGGTNVYGGWTQLGASFSGAAGQIQYGSYSVGVAGKYALVKATFVPVPTFKLALAVPLKAVADTEVVLNANGTTSNMEITAYDFFVGGAQVCETKPAKQPFCIYTFPDPAEAVEVKLVVTVVNGAQADKTATVKVVSAQEMFNVLCLGCHTGSTPRIIEAYYDSRHGDVTESTCVECHTPAPHNRTCLTTDCHGSAVLTKASESTASLYVATAPYEWIGHDTLNCLSCHTLIPDSVDAYGNIYTHGYVDYPTSPDPFPETNTLPCLDCHTGTLHSNSPYSDEVATHIEGTFTSSSGTRVTCAGCHTFGLARDTALTEGLDPTGLHDVALFTGEVRPAVWADDVSPSNDNAIEFFSHDIRTLMTPGDCARKCHYEGNLVGADLLMQLQ